MGVFFLLFVILPIVEMTILIKVGAVIGALNTIGLVLLTAVLGAALLRHQGLATLLKANQRLNSGELPAKEVAEGLILAVGGALLLTPGFVTDTVGFLCLLPGTRHWLAAYALKRMTVTAQSRGGSHFEFTAGRRGPFGADGGFEPFADSSRRDRDDQDNVIEGEFEEESGNRPGEDSDRIEKK